MAKFPLRTYIQQIESQIDSGEIDSAIAHANNVLRVYPKHIDTYRLLGKAYLDSQRYTDAASVLQRVLSVYPDDFVSQIGMSLIRENENKLDEAIWHMERAYEVQPFNPAVQDELRKLYGRRDGVQPPKIRLTRGALVRMYARGELYTQAIAEARAALVESPERVDLQALLCRLYYENGEKVKATEAAAALISHLPYCYQANRILADVLPTTARAEEAKVYAARIYALDPYEAFVSPNAPTRDQVPDQAVMIEDIPSDTAGLTTLPGSWEDAPEQSDQNAPQEELPNWLNTLAPTADTSAFASTPISENASAQASTTSDAPAADELIPDFMKAAGWQTSDGVETPPPPGMFENDSTEAAPAEIPDWLRDIAPETPASETPAANMLPSTDDWIASLDMTDTAQPSVEQNSALPGDLPGWMNELPAENQAPADAIAASDGLPSLFDEQPAVPTSDLGFQAESSVTAEPAQSSEMPDWLSSLGEPAALADTNELPAAEPAEMPDWLASLGQPDELASSASTEASLPHTEPVADFADDTDSWLSGLGALPPDQPVSEPLGKPAAEPGEMPDWLASLAQPQESEATAYTEQIEMGQPGIAPASTAETPVELPAEAAEMPDWLNEIKATDNLSESETKAAQEMPDNAPIGVSAELPDWLSEMGAPAAIMPDMNAAEPVQSEAERADQLPDWLAELGQPENMIASELPTAQPSAMNEQTQSQMAEEPISDDDSFAWLESLAAKQGADAETLSTTPEERPENAPEWINAEISGEAVESLEADEDPFAAFTQPTEETPPIKQPIAEQPAAEQPAAEAEPASNLPEWLTAVQPQTSEQEKTQPIRIKPAETAVTETPILETPVAETPAAEAIPEPASAEVDSVMEVPSETVGAPQAAMPNYEDTDAMMAWLEALAAKHGAQEETLTTAPEQRSDAMPDWLSEEIADQPIAETPAQPENLPSVDLPTQQMQEPATTDAIPDSDDAFAWLEALAAKQGADAETLSTPADERPENAPEWVQKEANQAAVFSDVIIPESTPHVQPIAQEPALQVPEQTPEPPVSALPPAPITEAAQIVSEPIAPVDETPDWLKSALPADPQRNPEDTLAVWLRDLEEPAKAKTQPASVTPEPPSWVMPETPEPARQPEAVVDQVQPPATVAANIPAMPAAVESQPAVAQINSLADAQQALNSGKLEPALEAYAGFIQNGQNLEEVVHDLRDALYRYPVDVSIWQTLGDAFARNNQLQDALDAYTKAEELLR